MRAASDSVLNSLGMALDLGDHCIQYFVKEVFYEVQGCEIF